MVCIRTMSTTGPVKPKPPLEGVTLEKLLTTLVEHYGWETLSGEVKINCFTNNPSIKSSLTFLRRTPWARAKVEQIYLEYLAEQGRPKY